MEFVDEFQTLAVLFVDEQLVQQLVLFLMFVKHQVLRLQSYQLPFDIHGGTWASSHL